MKKHIALKIIGEAVSILILPIMLLCVVLIFSNRDLFVTYDSNISEQRIASVGSENSVMRVSADSEEEYYAPQLLPDDIYRIVCEGEKICVYNSQNEKVYTAHARLSDFPENDRLVLVNEITSLTLNELLEIMEYIES